MERNSKVSKFESDSIDSTRKTSCYPEGGCPRCLDTVYTQARYKQEQRKGLGQWYVAWSLANLQDSALAEFTVQALQAIQVATACLIFSLSFIPYTSTAGGWLYIQYLTANTSILS